MRTPQDWEGGGEDGLKNTKRRSKCLLEFSEFYLLLPRDIALPLYEHGVFREKRSRSGEFSWQLAAGIEDRFNSLTMPFQAGVAG